MDKSGNEAGINPSISMAERIAEIEAEHKSIDMRIQALINQGGADLDVVSLKRKKLKLKDEMVRIRHNMLPDIIA